MMVKTMNTNALFVMASSMTIRSIADNVIDAAMNLTTTATGLITVSEEQTIIHSSLLSFHSGYILHFTALLLHM